MAKNEHELFQINVYFIDHNSIYFWKMVANTCELRIISYML